MFLSNRKFIDKLPCTPNLWSHLSCFWKLNSGQSPCSRSPKNLSTACQKQTKRRARESNFKQSVSVKKRTPTARVTLPNLHLPTTTLHWQKYWNVMQMLLFSTKPSVHPSLPLWTRATFQGLCGTSRYHNLDNLWKNHTSTQWPRKHPTKNGTEASIHRVRDLFQASKLHDSFTFFPWYESLSKITKQKTSIHKTTNCQGTRQIKPHALLSAIDRVQTCSYASVFLNHESWRTQKKTQKECPVGSSVDHQDAIANPNHQNFTALEFDLPLRVAAKVLG